MSIKNKIITTSDTNETRIAVLENTTTYINDNLKRIENKVDGIDKKLDVKVEGLDKKVESKFDYLDKKIESKFEIVDSKIEKLDKKIETKSDGIEKKIEQLSGKVDLIFINLTNNMSSNFKWLLGILLLSILIPLIKLITG